MARVVPGAGMKLSLAGELADQDREPVAQLPAAQTGTGRRRNERSIHDLCLAHTAPPGADSVLKALSAPLGQDGLVW